MYGYYLPIWRLASARGRWQITLLFRRSWQLKFAIERTTSERLLSFTYIPDTDVKGHNVICNGTTTKNMNVLRLRRTMVAYQRITFESGRTVPRKIEASARAHQLEDLTARWTKKGLAEMADLN
jgi:hypothetical protein